MTTAASESPVIGEAAPTGFYGVLVPDELSFFAAALIEEHDQAAAAERLADFALAWCQPEMEWLRGVGADLFCRLQETFTRVYGARHGARPLLMQLTAPDADGRQQLAFEIGLPHQPTDAGHDECQLPTRLLYLWVSEEFVAELRTALGRNRVLLSVGATMTVTTVLDRPQPE